MKIIENIIIADEGKVLRSKCHGVILGTEVCLKEIFKDGKLQLDSVDNYEEVIDYVK